MGGNRGRESPTPVKYDSVLLEEIRERIAQTQVWAKEK